jgi:hypothetical protein
MKRSVEVWCLELKVACLWVIRNGSAKRKPAPTDVIAWGPPSTSSRLLRLTFIVDDPTKPITRLSRTLTTFVAPLTRDISPSRPLTRTDNRDSFHFAFTTSASSPQPHKSQSWAGLAQVRPITPASRRQKAAHSNHHHDQIGNNAMQHATLSSNASTRTIYWTA